MAIAADAGGVATGLGFWDFGDLENVAMVRSRDIPGVTKECFLKALKYLKTSKQHPFETPGRVFAKMSISLPPKIEESDWLEGNN